MITFTATDEQVREVLANAVNASIPMGLGHLHYDGSYKFSPDDFLETNYLSLDYVQGRMVKLHIQDKGDGVYRIFDSAGPRADYQSWVTRYPTYENLLASAGITNIQSSQ